MKNNVIFGFDIIVQLSPGYGNNLNFLLFAKEILLPTTTIIYKNMTLLAGRRENGPLETDSDSFELLA